LPAASIPNTWVIKVAGGGVGFGKFSRVNVFGNESWKPLKFVALP